MTLETLLSERKAAISDGAMGTELMKLGLELGVPSVLWNVQPKRRSVVRPSELRGCGSRFSDHQHVWRVRDHADSPWS